MGLRYRYGLRQRWLPLGRYPDIPLAEARKRAARERVNIYDGVDVVAERQRKRVALRAAQTFKELADDYMTNAAAGLKSRNEIQRYLDRDVLPALGALRIEEATAAGIVGLAKKIAKRGAPDA